MKQETSKKLQEQVKNLESLSDSQLINKIPELRKESLPDLTPFLINRWFVTKDENLRHQLYEYFIDTKIQDEISYFFDAINNDAYAERKSELLSMLWQSSLDSSEYFEELVKIAAEGDYMSIIEVSTIIDSFDSGFEEDIILDAAYLISEHIDEEEDEERKLLLENLRQIINELYSI